MPELTIKPNSKLGKKLDSFTPNDWKKLKRTMQKSNVLSSSISTKKDYCTNELIIHSFDKKELDLLVKSINQIKK